MRRFGRKGRGNPCKIMSSLMKFTGQMDNHGFAYTDVRDIPYYTELYDACGYA